MKKPKPSQKKVLGSTGKVKEKKPFVMTEARKKAFENARAIRMEMADQRRIVKEKEKVEHNKIKKILKDKKELKLKKKQKLGMKVLETSSEEEEEQPPPPPPKKKRNKPKTPPPPESDSETESEEEEPKPKQKSKSKKNVIIINNTIPKQEEKPIIKIKPRPIGLFI